MTTNPHERAKKTATRPRLTKSMVESSGSGGAAGALAATRPQLMDHAPAPDAAVSRPASPALAGEGDGARKVSDHQQPPHDRCNGHAHPSTGGALSSLAH